MSENGMMQKDLVLSINEYAYVLDKTKGNVLCHVGPTKTSLSQSDELVRFDYKKKKFIPCGYSEAISLFATAPENWYIVLKNPTPNGKRPQTGTSNNLPEDIQVGCKVNIPGPVSFALYPGQMAKSIKGHALRSNQYLLARVYDAEKGSASSGQVLDAEGKPVESKTSYVNGQILVIKGTDVSFYIPPTGIEVIPMDTGDYVRDAVTLERLEYCILKDEDGNKRYVHGPEVVFPEPTETFVTSPKGGLIFRAIELSKISGIYIKVIAEYADEDGTSHPVGEEMFITGAKQMIYYPRPEHAIITYDNKVVHHAIAIPNGEGRYVMNRLTGDIKTVRGPAMFLPDPRTEIVVKRKLTESQCRNWYPGNDAALMYNIGLNERAVEKAMSKGVAMDGVMASFSANSYDSSYSTSCYDGSDINREASTLAYLESNAGISRGTSYTKPRTITLDNRFEGVVSIDIWTGYAVNIISKDGSRKVVCGPQTILLDYDQTLEVLEMSTGKPKTTDRVEKTVFLRHENNKISDYINIETKDFVTATVKVSYCVDFEKESMDKWFNVENYVKYLCDRQRSLIKREAKKYTIEEFYQNYSDIVRDVVINTYKPDPKATIDETPVNLHKGRFFPENGMVVHDVEVLSLDVEAEVAEMLEAHQFEMVKQSLKLTDAEKRVAVAEKLSEAETKEQELHSQQLINKMELQRTEAIRKLAIQSEVNRQTDNEKLASKMAEQDMQVILDAIKDAELARTEKETQAALEAKKKAADIEKLRQDAYAETIVKIMGAVGPDLVAAMTSKSNEQMLSAVTQAMAPYAIAKGESIPDVVNTLLRGTSLENILDGVNLNVK